MRLGPRVLRTETAGIVALAVLQALWGDLHVAAGTPQPRAFPRAIISSSRSKSGISGYSLTMRTWQITGAALAEAARVVGVHDVRR